MQNFRKRNCKICSKPAMQNRAVCYQCHLAAQRKKREAKLAKQAESKAKKKARFEQGETYRKRLFKKAWKVFSEYVRNPPNRYNPVGVVHCYTCETMMNSNCAHAGHFIHGRLDFDERNVHPQCVKCNTFLHGNLGVYAERLIDEGIDLKKLRRDAEEKGNDYSIAELKEIIDKFTK